MTPRAIVERASSVGLDAIAICDHNSARNAGACIRAASNTRLLVIPGLEITTSEEVHILGLFEKVEHAEQAQEEIYARLYGVNDEGAIGVQAVVNEFDEVEDLDERLLIGASTLDSSRVTTLIHSLGGLAVASHVDRSGFGIFSQLGFIPSDLDLDALEVSSRSDFESVRNKFKQARDYALISSSDAHRLEEIGSIFTEALMLDLNFHEICMAIRGESKRRILGHARIISVDGRKAL